LPSSAVQVESVIVGGQADMSRQVRVGDRVVEVNGIDTSNLSVDEVKVSLALSPKVGWPLTCLTCVCHLFLLLLVANVTI
jgi:C-terminal processing protease CtpA/Prc